jgi:hypothetical protein
MRDDDRAKLREAQEGLARALADQGQVPKGFDAGRVKLSIERLQAKRMHAARRALPALARALEGQYGELFAIYSKRQRLPSGAAPIDDAKAFARHLRHSGKLPGGVRRVVMTLVPSRMRTLLRGN